MRKRLIRLEITGTVVHVHDSLTSARIVEAVERQFTHLEDPGFCVHCGAEASNVEPNARGYKCGNCGLLGVYGAEELLIQLT